jgi:hypothetical protein
MHTKSTINPEGRRPFGRLRSSYEDNIKMYHKLMWLEDMD